MVDPSDRHLFINRELSWLAFNDRVLAEARNASLPIHERIKFLSIVSSNLDEFFMVRVAGLKRRIATGLAVPTNIGTPPAQVLAEVSAKAHELQERHARAFRESLKPQLDDAGIHALNQTYRHKDKPTDVLAFPLQELAPLHTLPAPPEGLLGDVILSIETARKQAKQHRRPLLGELTMLLAHGLLHLLGYDHQTDAEERDMTVRTRTLEAAAGARSRG